MRTGIATTGMAITRSRAAVENLLEQKFGYGLKRGLFRNKQPPASLDAELGVNLRRLSQAVEGKEEGLTGFTDPAVHQKPNAGQRKPDTQ